MNTVNITAVDSTMAFYDSSVPQPLIDAWQNCAMFAQAVARGAGNTDPSTEGYFNSMTSELQDLGWNVSEAGRVNYNQQANKISPAAIVSSILNPYLSAAQQAQLAGVLNGIQQPDVSMTNFLDFFWKKASVSASKVGMATGPLTVVNNASNITMIYYGFNFDSSSWRSLFVEQDSASLAVSAFNLEMNLNMSMYNSISGDLIAKLAGKEKDHIANAKTSF
jgi:hypothetical protein